MIKDKKMIAVSSARGENKPVVSRRWSKEEKMFLKNWLDSGWDWVFPGYKVAAFHVNNEFNNNRSAAACRAMDYRLCNGG